MLFTSAAVLEAGILALSLSIDVFAAGFAYGGRRIRIPAVSVLVVTLICASVTGLSLLFGAVVRPFLPPWLATAAAFTILFVIGVAKLLDSVTKSIIRKHAGISKEIQVSMFNFRFILRLYANPEDADVDASTTISPREATALALALSLDGMAAGFGAALISVNAAYVFLWSLATTAAFMAAGQLIGRKAAQKLPGVASLLSGAVLIGLAFFKLL